MISAIACIQVDEDILSLQVRVKHYIVYIQLAIMSSLICFVSQLLRRPLFHIECIDAPVTSLYCFLSLLGHFVHFPIRPITITAAVHFPIAYPGFHKVVPIKQLELRKCEEWLQAADSAVVSNRTRFYKHCSS